MILSIKTVSLTMENYKHKGNIHQSMEINQEKLKSFGIIIGSVLGYIAILTGIIMTILLLRTIFFG